MKKVKSFKETMSSSVDTILKKLRSDVMINNWTEVFEAYRQERALRTAKITGTGDTLLHIAVSEGLEKVVADMVDLVLEDNNLTQNDVVLMVDGDRQETRNMNVVLVAENDKNNTPLHLAAIKGNVEMCKKIVGTHPSLIDRRNIAGETPIFLAALYGMKEAFLWLHYRYMAGVSSIDFAHCIRDNGDTILHCTIAQGHIDVAIEIVHLYKEHMKKMMERNKEGLSPLHLLASKPSAFESTMLLEESIVCRVIYGDLKVEKKNQATTLEELQKKNQENFLVKYINFIKLLYALFLYLLCPPVRRLQKIKEKHTWTLQIMNELLQQASNEDMSQIISKTAPEYISVSLQTEDDDGRGRIESQSGTVTIETPLMIATKNGVTEMVKKILELFPWRIKDVNAEGKNIVLLAVQYRQTHVFRFLHKQKWLTESLFRQVDKEGNNALHLAARLGVDPDWLNPGEALSMTRELNWFEFVKDSMPYGLLERYNKKMETPDDIFRESHKQLMKSDGEWVAKTSQACSVVSTLVVSVAFGTCTNVPGGYDANNGYAILRNKPPVFKFFVGSSIAAILFSLISTIYFLSIVASPSQSVHSWRYVPLKLYFSMTSMFVAIVSLWISFCAGHFFMLDDDRHKLNKALPVYIFLSSNIMFFIVKQIPTLLGPTLSSFQLTPPPKRKATSPIEYKRTKNNENGTDMNHQN